MCVVVLGCVVCVGLVYVSVFYRERPKGLKREFCIGIGDNIVEEARREFIEVERLVAKGVGHVLFCIQVGNIGPIKG